MDHNRSHYWWSANPSLRRILVSRLIYDARDLSAPTLHVVEPELEWADLEKAPLVRKYMQELRQKDAKDARDID
jgi:hypothetical protein